MWLDLHRVRLSQLFKSKTFAQPLLVIHIACASSFLCVCAIAVNEIVALIMNVKQFTFTCLILNHFRERDGEKAADDTIEICRFALL